MKLLSMWLVVFHAMSAYAFPYPQQQQASASASASGRDSGSGGSSGGNLGVECKTEKSGDGRYKVNCAGVNQDAISLKSEHILWLQGPAGSQSVIDIEVPNYKIVELIKAGYKLQGGERQKGNQINILLKKPEQTYDAQVDELKTSVAEPSVNLQYEPVKDTVVHFPNDKQYSPLQGPILPPAQGGPNPTSDNAASASDTSGTISAPPPRAYRQTNYYTGNKQVPRVAQPLPNLKNHQLTFA